MKKEIHKTELNKILAKYKLEKISKISSPKTGMVNTCFFINDKYIIRINTRNKNIAKLEGEYKTIRAIKKKGKADIPEIIAYDNTKEIIPYEYIISKIENFENLKEKLDNITINQQQKLITDAGIKLASLHKIEFNYFGNIVFNSNYDNWYKYLKQHISTLLEECQNTNIISKDKSIEIINILKKNKKILENIESRLIHFDYNFSNLLCSKNKVEFIIDFEFSRFGDSIFDLAILEIEEFEDELQKKEWFYNGYFSNNPKPNNFEFKISLYKLLYLIEISIPIKKYRTKEALNWIQKEIQELVKKLY